MPTAEDLKNKLRQLDGRGYKAYKDIKGRYTFPAYTLCIDYVQGDPFATPSRFRIIVPQETAQFPKTLTQNKIRRIALADYLTRRFHYHAKQKSKNRGIGKSGLIEIDRPRQEVLARTSATIDDVRLEVRFFIGLPARGRTILGGQAIEMIHSDLPQIVEKALKFQNLDQKAVRLFVETVEDAEAIRSQLKNRGLVAFVGNGALLPRKSGIDPCPLDGPAVPFQSPPAFQVTLNRPNAGDIRGMGIPAGVTLIVGGGYHGKSTLLRAIEFGVYNHPPGDGREFVVTDADAVKIRAEDGRAVSGVDISPFIANLPQEQSTRDFSTQNASGSTSQAANIIEALELQPSLLLIDEDTAATNFMIRDHRMQELIAKEKEPITPFIDKVRQLYREYGVSSLLVIGGSGDYFETADQVIALENYRPHDVTKAAKAIAEKYASERTPEGGGSFGTIRERAPLPQSLNPKKAAREVYLKTHDVETIIFGAEKINLSAVEQLVEPGQARAIAHALLYAKAHYIDGERTLSEITDRLMHDIENEGLDKLTGIPYGDLAVFRRFEWAAALNRLRTLKIAAASERAS
ncbi:MAG: ABC-ATPase domain-containing protein [Nitrospiria bacterium]